MDDLYEALLSIEPDLTDLRPLAEAGQKIVIRATDPVLGEVVVKVVKRPDDLRVLQEIQLGQTHAFAHVPTIHRSGELLVTGTRQIYIIEDFIDGTTLFECLERGTLPEADALRLLDAILGTIVELEAERIVHRDIKPLNIMIDTAGEVWLLDFGIARVLDRTIQLTDAAAPGGPHSPGYAPPEVYLNRPELIDSRADLFSLAVVVHEAMTGAHPYFEAGVDIRESIENGRHARLAVDADPSGQISELVAIMMTPRITMRPPTAETARKWLDDIREGEGA